MLDASFLGSWIKPRHTDEHALAGLASSFASHPAQMATVADFLVDDVAAKLSRFLAGEGSFAKEHGLYSQEGAVTEERWRAAAEEDRFFRFGKLVGTPPEFAFSANALTYLRFRTVFQDDRFKAFFEALSGLELGSSDDFGSHAMASGDFLRPHDDDNRDRRLAIVVYLTPGWTEELGGALHVSDPQGRTHTVPADYNNMVVFDTRAGTTHRVAPIESAAGDRARLTIGGWYHKP